MSEAVATLLRCSLGAESAAFLFDPTVQPALEPVERLSASLRAFSAESARVTSRAELDALGAARGAALSLIHAWPSDFTPQRPWQGLDPVRTPPVLPAFAEHGVDLELAALEAGLRRLVKREGVPGAAGAVLSSRWQALGLACAAVGSTWFVAKDASVLSRALAAEQALSSSHTPDAALELGELLGYPTCCVEAFSRITRADDFTASACSLPPVPTPSASAFGLWLDPSLRLVSHFACGLACAKTEALGRSLFELLVARVPSAAEVWRGLARRIHIIDRAGRQLALEAQTEASADGRVMVSGAAEVVHSGGGARVVEVLEWAGVVLAPFAGGLRSADGAHWAVLSADHRG